MKTFFTRIFPLLLTIVLPFIAGLIVLNEGWLAKVIAAALLIIAIACVFIAEWFSLSIKGYGIKNITSGPDAPKNPSKNDLWIDTNDH